MDVNTAREKLVSYQKKAAAYLHALELLNFDGATSAPRGSASTRGETMAILSGELYAISTSAEVAETLFFLESVREELTAEEARIVYLLQKDSKKIAKIPRDLYVAYRAQVVRADDVWHRAKESSDYALFSPELEKIFDMTKEIASNVEPDSDPYDFCLHEYEEGLNSRKLDDFFDTLRERISPLLRAISKVPQQSDAIRKGFFAASDQEKLSRYLMDIIGLDPEHVALSTTEHPFTISLGSHLDERITTHYYEDDFASSMYSVIHEGGHALYETGCDDRFVFTALDGGTAMSIHESQSRFYENIIGRSRAFCSLVFPKVREIFPEQMKGYSAEDLYRAVNRVEPSLIRTESDEVTYCFHIMIRYELEKRLMHGELTVRDLPQEWNRLYREYLGVEVPNDKVGVLQDTHWSGGMIGYFPSYALGNAYGAQFFREMKKEIDVEKCILSGNLAPINEWNRKNIWQFGKLYTPDELIRRITGGEFDPAVYADYLTEKYSEIYGL
ncbi:MAG: carboxypeptidase M32 [Clostridia bacterium]|nr:carboxypeptidase M32 [Clostridia bacterium]